MSTSPTSERNALLWGDRWWVAGSNAPLPFGDVAHAADVLVEFFAQDVKPVRLRLIFQPDTFETIAAACPKGDRRTLEAALAAEYPSLANPECAWGHDPILAADGGFSTLLHFEREPRLFALVARLEQLGILVESAWPLPTFLQALPDDLSETGALTVLALGSDAGCAFRHPADGRRETKAWRGESAIGDAGEWLATILGPNASEPVLLVVTDDAVMGALNAHVWLDDKPGLRRFTLSDALAREVILPKRHPAQLLPRVPVLTPHRVAVAASFAFFALAAWSGFTYARETIAWRTAGEARERQKHTLRTEIAHLRANAAEMANLHAQLDRAVANPSYGALLDKVVATMPPEIVLHSIKAEARRFSLGGHIAPGTTPEMIETWRGRMADTHWAIDPIAKPDATGTFTLTGEFKS